jgi:hypothetical protein
MILKVLDYRQGKEQNHVFEEWTFLDNIVSASSYYDEDSKLPVVRCKFRDDSTVTISIPNVAYLMSDIGKTIDKIVPADVEELGDTEPIYNTLQDAVAEAMS